MEWPTQLVSDIASRRAVLFFGAGVSMNSVARDGITRPKNWISFLEQATGNSAIKKSLAAEVRKLIKKNDLLTACEVIRKTIGRDAFVSLVKNEFQTPGFQPAKIHELLWQLDLRITITPNFDNIYDSFVAQRGSGTVTIKSYHDLNVADSLRRHEHVLIKSHGSVTHPDQLIFTRVDYAKARNENRAFYELLDSLLRTHTFLFVGCGLEDPDIRLLLEDYCFRHQQAQQHYFVIADKRFSEPVKSVFEDSLKIKLVEYKYTADHGNLVLGLETLVKDVEATRNELGKTLSW